MKILALLLLLFPFHLLAQDGSIKTLKQNPQKKDSGTPVCRSARFRMVSDCADLVYYDQDQDAVFTKKGSPFTGSCKTCHFNGNLEMFLTFANGKPSGQDTIYYENGQINLVRSHDVDGYGKENGKWIFYREDGTLKWEKNYVMGGAEGEFRYYHSDSTLQKIETWKNNKMNGKKQEFYPNQNVKKEVNYKNGIWDGAFRTYFEDGKIESEQIYTNDKKEGPSTYYFDDGTVFYTENHEAGELEGTSKRFYKGGRRWTVENYKKGARHGIFEEYYDNEKNVMKYDAVYKKGELQEERFYDEFGDEVSKPGEEEEGEDEKKDEKGNKKKDK